LVFPNEFNSALFSAYVYILIGAMLMGFAVDTFLYVTAHAL